MQPLKQTNMKFDYPFVIDNGGAEQLTFLGITKKNNIDCIEIAGIVQPKAGPPMHVHHQQDETITIVKGKMGTQILNDQSRFHTEGETVTFKAGVPHRFWNSGDEPLHTIGYASPPNNLVYFLSGIYSSTKANGGKRPGLYDSAFLLTRYKSEFDMVDIPVFVKKIIFPLALLFGRLTGKNKKFIAAPKPL